MSALKCSLPTGHRLRKIGRMLSGVILAVTVRIFLIGFCGLSLSHAAEKINISTDWRFARFGPMADGSVFPEPAGLQATGVDDSAWRRLDLPHDWGIEGPFRADLPNNTGKLPWAGIGWYRKALEVPAVDAGNRIFLYFEGAMSHPEIFVNGSKAGEWAYGYSSFFVDITDHLKFGGPNLLAVRLNNPADSSRWYPGGGIYRHVWLVKSAPVHVAHWGVFVHVPDISAGKADVVVETKVENQSLRTIALEVRQEIVAPAGGRVVAVLSDHLPDVAAGASAACRQTLQVAQPEHWGIDSPKLYLLRTILVANGKEVDRQETPFGIRSIEWNATKGFLLNGRVVKLQGVCNHHDLGALGTAFNLRAAERQLELLRAMGCNALRTTHNPPAPGLLDLCDRMGFLVVDELFDCWKLGKTPNDYSRDYDLWHERDVANLVQRDRNHPAVILWSSGNEIREQGNNRENQDRSRHLTALFHREDPTRLVGSGMNQPSSLTNGFAQTFDVAGYNYKAILAKELNYNEHLRTAPQQPFFGAETASTVSSRGEYFFPVSLRKDGGFFRFQVSSYDLYAPAWANTPDLDFDSADQLPMLAGEFVWTGFDYIGEPTPYNKDETNLLNFASEAERQQMQEGMRNLGGHPPSRSSYFGILDLAGFPKDRYYLYQSRWRPELPMAHLLPHWTWPGREGEATPVHLYTSGDEAELFLNGRSLGRKKKGEREYRLRWDDVRYEPGELKAVAYKNGVEWAVDSRRTTGPAASLRLAPDRTTLRADGEDLAFVTASIRDERGDVVPDASQLVKFTVTGPAVIVGVDNGDATSLTSMQASQVKVFHGLALVILRTLPGRTGEVILTAKTEGMAESTSALLSAGNKNMTTR
jgi:beta-galactosidase